MNEQHENETAMRDGEDRLDYRIRVTKNDLKLDNLYATHPYRGTERNRYFDEYGFGYSRGPIIRRGIWLTVKLGVLYLLKAGRWLVHLRKRR